MANEHARAPPQLDTRVRVPERVLMRLVGEELVLLNLDAESYYGLNPVGARLMQLAEGTASLEQIIERMLTEFEVERERLQSDVRSLAADLIAAGLLENEAAP